MKSELFDVASTVSSVFDLPEWMKSGGWITLIITGIVAVLRLGKLLRALEDNAKATERMERQINALNMTVARLCDHAGIEPTPMEAA